MIRVLEAPMIMDENAERFHLMGNRVIPVELQGEKRDPIFELFNPLDEKKLGKLQMHKLLMTMLVIM